MTRKRGIDPNIWEDPSFNQLSTESRLLFIGMISNADDKGYLRADAGSLKRTVFGFDEVKIEQVGEWIEELSMMKNLHIFQVENESYAHFLKWDEYQKQQRERIQPSVYPKCSICVAPAKQVLTQVSKSSKEVSKQVNKEKEIDKEKETKLRTMKAELTKKLSALKE